MKAMNTIALALIIVGGLNWGLVGLFDFNLVSALFGVDTIVTEAVYVVVGIAALYSVFLFKPAIETPKGRDTYRKEAVRSA